MLRRFASLFYEALLLGAVLWCAALPLVMMEDRLSLLHVRSLNQLYLAVIAGVYFVWQWTRGAQTLAMKTWKLKLVACDGGAVSVRRALIRYAAALLGLAFLGIGFLWALFDREGLFLHDRIAGTRIVRNLHS